MPTGSCLGPTEVEEEAEEEEGMPLLGRILVAALASQVPERRG